MPQAITLYRVFLAAPSDVDAEIQIVEELLRDWNLQHGQVCGVRVEFVGWRTHTRPATGKRPQSLVNKQAFDACDLVVAIFWSQLGTPTGRAESGTVEEIKRGIRQCKPVLVYFSKIRAPKRKPIEQSRIELFRREFGQKAIYWEYSDLNSFEKSLRNHLAGTMHELLNNHTARHK